MGWVSRTFYLVTGAGAGAGAVIAFYRWLRPSSPPAVRSQPAVRSPEPINAAAAAATAEVEQLKRQVQAVQADLQMRTQEAGALRSELDSQQAWQTRVPALARLGQSMARLPRFKAAAADAAVASLHLPSVVNAPQDMASVHGIGPTYEQRLYAAGVGTYWELAHLSDEDFVRILKLSDLQRKVVDLNTIRADALRLAQASGWTSHLWEGPAPDDLEPIKGIGKFFEQRLYDAGIRTYRALAGATPEQLHAICGADMPVQPDYASWIEQAKALAGG